MLSNRLQSVGDLLEAASLCRSLAISDIDGSGAFLLFALYFENVAALREASPVDADIYESCMAQLVDHIQECLFAIENLDPIRLMASLDSFARLALRAPLG